MARRTVTPKKQQDTILTVVRKGFVDVGRRLDRHDHRFDAMDAQFVEQRQEIASVKENLASLTSSVDRFAKIYTTLNHELSVLRQHMRDMEARVQTLEQKLKTA